MSHLKNNKKKNNNRTAKYLHSQDYNKIMWLCNVLFFTLRHYVIITKKHIKKYEHNKDRSNTLLVDTSPVSSSTVNLVPFWLGCWTMEYLTCNIEKIIYICTLIQLISIDKYLIIYKRLSNYAWPHLLCII